MRDARMIFVESSGAEARSASVDTYPLLTWLAHIPVKDDDVQVGWRTADVGAIVLSEVIVVSHHEAKVATATARAAATRATEKDADVLRFCDVVETLIATTKGEYFSAWVIIETADID